MLPLEGNDRLSSSSKGRVRENFLINQQMSTFTSEIRIESAESASVPRCRSITSILPVDYIELFFLVLKWENPDLIRFMLGLRVASRRLQLASPADGVRTQKISEAAGGGRRAG